MIDSNFKIRFISKAREIKQNGGVGPKNIGLSNSKFDKLYNNNKKSDKIIEKLSIK